MNTSIWSMREIVICSSCRHDRSYVNFRRGELICLYCVSRRVPKTMLREQRFDIILEICQTINRIKHSPKFLDMGKRNKHDALKKLRRNRTRYSLALCGVYVNETQLSLNEDLIPEIEDEKKYEET